MLATVVDRMKVPNKEELDDQSNHIPLDEEAEEKTPLLAKRTIKIFHENSKLFKHFYKLFFLNKANQEGYDPEYYDY